MYYVHVNSIKIEYKTKKEKRKKRKGNGINIETGSNFYVQRKKNFDLFRYGYFRN